MREGKLGVHSLRRVEYMVMTTREEGTGCWPISESSSRRAAEARDTATEQCSAAAIQAQVGFRVGGPKDRKHRTEVWG